MPKFLDAPSWYDSDGTLQTIQRVVSLNLSTPGYGLMWKIPVTNAKLSQETDNYYVVPGAGTNAGSILSWQNNGGVYSWGTLSRGTSGRVLTSTSSGIAWQEIDIPKLYGISFHNAQPGSPSTNSVDLYIMSSTYPNITDMYGVQDLVQAAQESGNWITISLINGYVSNTYRPVSISYLHKITQPIFTGLVIEGMDGSASITEQIPSNTYDDYTVRTYPYDFTKYVL